MTIYTLILITMASVAITYFILSVKSKHKKEIIAYTDGGAVRYYYGRFVLAIFLSIFLPIGIVAIMYFQDIDRQLVKSLQEKKNG